MICCNCEETFEMKKSEYKRKKFKQFNFCSKKCYDESGYSFQINCKYDVDIDWVTKFNRDKLSLLTTLVSKLYVSTLWFKTFVEYFYEDDNFNKIYDKWIVNKDSNMKPSLDHIIPISKGGTHDLDNLQIITWLENRLKWTNDLETWKYIKKNIRKYFI